MDKLELTDLFIACDKCGGTGQYTWKADPNTTRGPGMHQIGGYGPCDKCNGTGGTITPAGEVLAQFIEVLRRRGRL